MTKPRRKHRKEPSPAQPGTWHSTCPPPCGKTIFATRKEARTWGRKRNPEGHINAFECSLDPSRWHFGNLPVTGRPDR
jgi:hypothetical protein